ncbi:hypothetical protein [Mucilaginibacter psychrotolerans]|uniref:Uncharacterized protein n=1 Tax=Mucilaginibacter psychrotolerans TaxID=1524096 RepID=A0A4Y8SLQ5_9SPHI|nr:hypothetical protein [Mucilaginibacter psychrotolerans]TFF39610.1 hypothetical protein E2R66_04360 [Mucilaginibacter psychrotolerans]
MIEVVCSSCTKSALLIHSEAPVTVEHFLDIDYSSRIWEFNCIHCLKRMTVLWEETKKFSLTNKVEIGNEVVWAWNKNHLAFIVSVLKKEEITNHAWANFRTYINKSWLTKIHNNSVINKLEALLKNT